MWIDGVFRLLRLTALAAFGVLWSAVACAAQDGKRLDARGLPLPEGAVARLGNPDFAAPPRGSPGQDVYGSPVALSADGKLLALRGESIFIHDGATGKRLRTLPLPKQGANRLAWSSDGRLLAALDDKVELSLIDAESGKSVAPVTATKLDSHSVTAMRFTGSLLAIVGAPYRPPLSHREFSAGSQDAFKAPGWRVELWDVEKRSLSRAWADQPARDLAELGGDNRFCYVALSPRGERMAWLATSLPNAKEAPSDVFIYDTASGRLLRTLRKIPRSFRIDLPDEAETLVVYPVRPAKVENVVVGKMTVIDVFEGKTRFECDYRFHSNVSPGDAWDLTGRSLPERGSVRVRDSLITCDGLGLVRWDWKTGRRLDEYDIFFNQFYTGFATSADGKRLAVAEGSRVRVGDGDLASWQKDVQACLGQSVRFLPDGRLVGVSAAELGTFGGRVQVWDPRTKQRLDAYRLHPFPAGLDFPLGRDLSAKLLTYIENDHSLIAFDLAANQRVGTLPMKRGELTPSPDGKKLLHSNHRLTPAEYQIEVRWFDARTLKELGRHDYAFPNTGKGLEPVNRRLVEWFAHDGSVIGYLTPDNRLILVDCAAPKVQRPVELVQKDTPYRWRFAQYHSVGLDLLIHGDVDMGGPKQWLVWDRKGRLLRRSINPASGSWMMLTPDGRNIIPHTYSSTQVIFYETASGRERGRITLPNGIDTPDFRKQIDVSPDSTLLATSGPDTTILLWDLARPLGKKAMLPVPKDEKEAEQLWEVLANPDPQEADLALWALVKAPEPSLALLKQRLKPVSGPDIKKVQALIAQLNSANFKERDAANRELLRLEPTALSILRASLKDATLEQRRRVNEVIARLELQMEQHDRIKAFYEKRDDTLPYLRELRALEVLERIGTPAARLLLEAMANGADAVPTYEAQLILSRWAKAK